ncbi:MAG: efflux RND transporter periplasmic adaptor subunit, partial [Phycisphaerae bacterium]|nr:efflux RND transporter periplasmic adaptor subunit [Phycisphaerae bacterium]
MSEQTKWVRLFRKALPGLIVIAVLLGVVAIALFLKKRSDDKPPSERPPVNVVTDVIRPEASVLDTFEIGGGVEADRVVKVAAEVDGRVEEILCLKGKDVRKGQPIVRLNTDILQAEFDIAKAQAEFDAGEYKHIADLHKKDAATATEENQFRTRAAVSKAAFDIAKARLERATIVAPFDGTLDDVVPEVGTYVNCGDIVAVIVDMDPAKVVVDVPECDVPFLKIGQEEEIVIKGRAKNLTGKITYISKLIDRGSNTTRVEISVDNRTGLLWSGQIVHVRLLRRVLKDVILVPLEAVIPMEKGKKVVYVVEDGKAVRREVKIELALLSKQCVCIRSGLK